VEQSCSLTKAFDTVLLGACEPPSADWARRCLNARSPAVLATTTSTGRSGSKGNGEVVVLTVPKCDGKRREDGVGLLRFVQSILSQSSASPTLINNDPAMASLVQSTWALRSNVIYYSAADRVLMGSTKSNYAALSAYVTSSTCSALVPSLATLQPCKVENGDRSGVDHETTTAITSTKGWHLDLAKGTKCQGQSSSSAPFPCIGPPPPPMTHHPSPPPISRPYSQPSFDPTQQPTGHPNPLPSLYPSLQPTLYPSAVPYVRMGGDNGDGNDNGETMLPAAGNPANHWHTPLYLIGAVYGSTLALAACFFLVYRRWHSPTWTTIWDPDQTKATYDLDGNKHVGKEVSEPIDYVGRRRRRRRKRRLLCSSCRWLDRCRSLLRHLPWRSSPTWTTVWDPDNDDDDGDGPASPARTFTKGGATVYQASFEAEHDDVIKGNGTDEDDGAVRKPATSGNNVKERSKSPKSSSRLTAKVQLNAPPGPHDI